MDPQKINFLNGSSLGATFLYQQIFNRKIFHIVGGAIPRQHPKNQFFERLNLR